MKTEEKTVRRPSFEAIEEEIQMILDSFGDVEVGEVHDEHEELTPEQAQAIGEYLDELGTQEAEKVDGIAQYLRMLKARTDALRAESQHLAARARSLENQRKYLQTRYLQTMEAHGLTKVSGDTYTLSRRRTAICVIEDERAIPEAWINVKIEKSPAKKDILDALKRGEEIPGARIGETVSLIVR